VISRICRWNLFWFCFCLSSIWSGSKKNVGLDHIHTSIHPSVYLLAKCQHSENNNTTDKAKCYRLDLFFLRQSRQSWSKSFTTWKWSRRRWRNLTSRNRIPHNLTDYELRWTLRNHLALWPWHANSSQIFLQNT